MGLEPILDDPDIEVTFLSDIDYDVLRAEDLEGADAFVSYGYQITEETLAPLEDLQVITRGGAGFDNLDVDACTRNGVIASHAPQGPTRSVAEFTLGSLINCAFNVKGNEVGLRTQGFGARTHDNVGRELSSLTLGVIGVGQIGRTLLEYLAPFGMETLAYDPYLSEEQAESIGVQLVDLDELLATADLVSVHVPLTDETAGMLGEDEFRAMKESAYLINTSRGGIYRDADLARAVREGWIAGAAIDVYEDEPDVAGNPLLEHDDILLTPHTAAFTLDALNRIGTIMAESIVSVKNGELPSNILNPDAVDHDVPGEHLSPAFQP